MELLLNVLEECVIGGGVDLVAELEHLLVREGLQKHLHLLGGQPVLLVQIAEDARVLVADHLQIV